MMKNKKRKVLLGVLIVLVLCIGLFMKNKVNNLNNTSLNEESVTKELNGNLIGAYIQEGEEYIQTDDIPSSGYEFNEEKSYCKIGEDIQEGTTLSYDMDTQTLTVSPITKEGMKCYLYFDEKASAGDTILASENAPTNSTTDWTNGGKGITYYYTGNPNNWVEFAGFYWRIIRINGDGSIRMIYQGVADSSTPDSGNMTGTGTQIGMSAFNSSYNNKTYVGLVYDGSTQHGYGTNSTIMNALNNWYNNNIENDSKNLHYESYIDTGACFCSDRNMANGYNWSSSTVYYAAHDRYNGLAILQCNSEDILSQDNGKLIYPIGLLTSDEAVLTGITWSNANIGSYLHTGQNYWTMSPSWYNIGGGAFVFFVNSSGKLYADGNVNGTTGVRPVINIRADVEIIGEGTTSDPFKVVRAS